MERIREMRLTKFAHRILYFPFIFAWFAIITGIATFITGLVILFEPISSKVFYIKATMFWIILISTLIWGDK